MWDKQSDSRKDLEAANARLYADTGIKFEYPNPCLEIVIDNAEYMRQNGMNLFVKNRPDERKDQAVAKAIAEATVPEQYVGDLKILTEPMVMGEIKNRCSTRVEEAWKRTMTDQQGDIKRLRDLYATSKATVTKPTDLANSYDEMMRWMDRTLSESYFKRLNEPFFINETEHRFVNERRMFRWTNTTALPSTTLGGNMSEIKTDKAVASKAEQNLAVRKVMLAVEEENLAAVAASKALLEDVKVGKTDKSLAAIREALATEKRLQDEFANLKRVAGILS